MAVSVSIGSRCLAPENPNHHRHLAGRGQSYQRRWLKNGSFPNSMLKSTKSSCSRSVGHSNSSLVCSCNQLGLHGRSCQARCSLGPLFDSQRKNRVYPQSPHGKKSQLFSSSHWKLMGFNAHKLLLFLHQNQQSCSQSLFAQGDFIWVAEVFQGSHGLIKALRTRHLQVLEAIGEACLLLIEKLSGCGAWITGGFSL